MVFTDLEDLLQTLVIRDVVSHQIGVARADGSAAVGHLLIVLRAWFLVLGCRFTA
jgi:hypothetical protein